MRSLVIVPLVALCVFGCDRVGRTDQRPGWLTYHDTATGLSFQYPHGLFEGDEPAVEARCARDTQTSDTAVAGDETALSLRAVARRGSLELIAQANGVRILGDTVELGAFADGPAEVRRGRGWLAVSGTHAHRHYAPEGGLEGTDPQEVFFGVNQLSDDCFLVWLASNEEDEPYDVDTLAAVLASVRLAGSGTAERPR